MSALEITPVSPAEIAPISADLVARLSDAYGDAQSTLVSRVRAMRAALITGNTVKGIHSTMLSAAASDPSITVVSTTIYGSAAAAATLAGSIDGLPFSNVRAEDLALFARAAKHVGAKAFRAAASTALASLSDDIGGEERLIVLRDAFTLALSIPRADVVKAAAKVRAESEREARPDAGDGTMSDLTIDGERVTGRTVGLSVADHLANLHAATAFLQNGGEYSDDLASAVSQLASALSAARKRTRAAVATAAAA